METIALSDSSIFLNTDYPLSLSMHHPKDILYRVHIQLFLVSNCVNFLKYFWLYGYAKKTSLSMNTLQPVCNLSLVCPLCAHVTLALDARFAMRSPQLARYWHATLTVRRKIALAVRSRSGLLALCVSWYTRLISGAGIQTVQISFSLVNVNSLTCLQVIRNQ